MCTPPSLVEKYNFAFAFCSVFDSRDFPPSGETPNRRTRQKVILNENGRNSPRRRATNTQYEGGWGYYTGGGLGVREGGGDKWARAG